MSNLLMPCLMLCAGLACAAAQAQPVDKATRQGVVDSLPEAKEIKNAELRDRVYDAWAAALAKQGQKRIDETPASRKPGSAPLKNKTRLDAVRSVARFAMVYAKDLDDHFPLFEADMDDVIAGAVCLGLGDSELGGIKQFQKDPIKRRTADAVTGHAEAIFWALAEHEGFLEGGTRYPRPSSPITIGRPMEIKIDRSIRQGVIQSLPEAKFLKNPQLRERVYDAWALSLARSSFKRLEDLRASGSPNSAALKKGTQADHVRAVARLALAFAKEMQKSFEEFQVGMDEVLASGLLHDVGKPYEFDPLNQQRWQANPRVSGFPAMRHSVYGAHIALCVGLPEAIVHAVGAHSREGDIIERSTASELVRQADHPFWALAKMAGLLE